MSARAARLRQHLGQDLFRTGYLLIVGAAITSMLGVAFWSLAARTYSSDQVGIAAATISAMTLVSGVCSLGLYAVFVRYLPVAGTAARKLIVTSYALTFGLSLAVGAVAASTSSVWSHRLAFLAGGRWVAGFSIATALTTIFTLQDGVLTGLRAARWIPVENATYALAKLAVLLAIPGATGATPFIAWNAPVLPAVVLINGLIFRRLLTRSRSVGSLDRRTVFTMAAANHGANLFSLASTLYVPVLVANLTTASRAAFFYVPWLISVSVQLVALNMMTSLTVQAALDLDGLRRFARQAAIQSFRLVLPFVVVLLVAAPYLLLVFGRDYSNAGTGLLRVLAVGAVPNVVVALGIGVARVQERSRAVVATQASNAVVLIGVSAVLLPHLGLVAVGVAWLCSQTLLAIVMLGTLLRPLLVRGPAS